MMKMRMYYLQMIIAFVCFRSCTSSKNITNASTVLNQSIKVHDAKNNWNTTNLEIQIQEPRISNPHRYSMVKLNNNTGAFELSRNKEQHIAKYSINEKGESTVLLDDKKIVDSVIIKKYKLSANRNNNYKRFYAMMYGLPMSIPEHSEIISGGAKIIYNKEPCYKIEIELKEPIITKFWNVYISQKSNYVVGIEIFHEDDKTKGERMYFENLIEINDIKVPRIRHWYNLKNNDYGGSDIIIKEIQ